MVLKRLLRKRIDRIGIGKVNGSIEILDGDIDGFSRL